MDTGATDHIVGNLEKLFISDKYRGEQSHTTRVAGMKISHIDKSIIYTPHQNLKLLNILHVPQTAKTSFPFIV
jgi:hypothetical protein